jgi:ribokinase
LGYKQTMNAPNANLRLSVRDVRRAGAAVHAAQVLLVQLEPPLPAIMEGVRIARAAAVPVVLDAGPPRRLPDELIRRLAVIRANAGEAEVLTGVPVTDRPSARRAGKALLARGAGAAVIEAEDQGDLIVWKDGECWLPHIKVRVVDATGAGDAFAAALAVQLIEGRSWAEAGRFASVAAALTTTRLGGWPALPRRKEVLGLLKRLARRRVERIVLGHSTRGTSSRCTGGLASAQSR